MKRNAEPVIKTLKDLSDSAEQTRVVGYMPVDILMGIMQVFIHVV